MKVLSFFVQVGTWVVFFFCRRSERLINCFCACVTAYLAFCWWGGTDQSDYSIAGRSHAALGGVGAGARCEKKLLLYKYDLYFVTLKLNACCAAAVYACGAAVLIRQWTKFDSKVEEGNRRLCTRAHTRTIFFATRGYYPAGNRAMDTPGTPSEKSRHDALYLLWGRRVSIVRGGTPVPNIPGNESATRKRSGKALPGYPGSGYPVSLYPGVSGITLPGSSTRVVFIRVWALLLRTRTAVVHTFSL